MKTAFPLIPLTFAVLLSGCTLETECENAQKRCFTTEENVPHQQTCFEGFWPNEKDSVVCQYSCLEDNSECGECVNDEYKCEKGASFVCQFGKWTDDETGKGCRPPEDLKCTEEGRKLCKDGAIYVCTDQILEVESWCPDVSCNPDGTDCGECLNDTAKCEDGSEYLCVNGKWDHETPCPEATGCKSDNSECEFCVTDSQKCYGSVLYTCIDEQWDSGTPCENKASCMPDARQCGECKNNATQCTDDPKGQGIISRCNAARWIEEEHCPNNNSCKDDSTCGECKNDSTLCNDGTKSICEHGKWKTAGPCDTASENGKCVENETRCEKGVKTICIDGNWRVDEVCSTHACDETETDCSRCIDGTILCDNGKLRTCVDGIFDEGIPCRELFCMSDTECAECRNGQTKCADGMMFKCENNKWPEDAPPCNDNNSCRSETECGSCRDGSTRCENGQIQKCQHGTWENEKTCPTGTCNSSKTDCGTSVCNNGATKCEGGKKFTCQNGNWDSGKTCPSSASCNDAKTDCGTCTNDVHYECNQYLGVATFKTCKGATLNSKPTEYCRYNESCATCHAYTPHVRKITADRIKVRTAPSTNSDRINSVTKNAEVVVYAQTFNDNHNWFLIRFPYNGYQGAWIAAEEEDTNSKIGEYGNTGMTDYLETLNSIKSKCTQKITVNGPRDTSNIRHSPSTDYDENIIKEVPRWQTLNSCGLKGEWYEILFEPDQIAWIHKTQI